MSKLIEIYIQNSSKLLEYIDNLLDIYRNIIYYRILSNLLITYRKYMDNLSEFTEITDNLSKIYRSFIEIYRKYIDELSIVYRFIGNFRKVCIELEN